MQSSLSDGAVIIFSILICSSCGALMVMSKIKKEDKSGYHLYYMCQAVHSTGKLACKSKLINN
ncbi:recombinase zinc beta ribbon domain-containing protein [Bacillus cereus]|uniref:recombinase zinc beta ribbon domain-containing protein n=1 Tax=Bacillus cereus TaxID=1396 RepID=UPI003D18991B